LQASKIVGVNQMGFWLNGITMIFLHLAPNIAGASIAEYNVLHPYNQITISRFLQQGNRSHKAVNRGQHTNAGPKYATHARWQ
jgi:hypothetical protein